MKTVFIIDDHMAFREGIKVLLEDTTYAVVGESSFGKEGLNQLKNGDAPDILLLDINLPDISGFDILKEVRQTSIKSKVVMISGVSDPEIRERSFAAGTDGFVAKERVFETLEECFDKVMAGEIYGRVL